MWDINCSSYPRSFYPIGSEAFTFSGTLDGNQNVVSNLRIESAPMSTALFGYAAGGNIHDIGFENIFLSNDTGVSVAGIVGNSSGNTIIQRVFVTGTILGNSGVGGIVGGAVDTTIRDAYTIANVTGNYYTGGIIGDAGTGTVLERTYSDGILDALILGWSPGNRIGGIVGSNYYGTDRNSYSVIQMIDTTGVTSIGGIEGDHYSTTTSNLYWDITSTGQSNCKSDSNTNCTSTNNQESSYYGASGIPFSQLDWPVDVWQANDNNHPTFVWQ
jgi:hypothetical protein